MHPHQIFLTFTLAFGFLAPAAAKSTSGNSAVSETGPAWLPGVPIGDHKTKRPPPPSGHPRSSRPSDHVEKPQDEQDYQDRLHLAFPPVGPTTAHVTASSPAVVMGFSLPAPPEKAIRGPTWRLAGHQGQDVALLELLVAVEEDDRTEASRPAHPPEGRPADAEHFAYLFLGKQAFLGLPLPIPEGGWGSATGQDGLPVLKGQGLIQFQGGLD